MSIVALAASIVAVVAPIENARARITWMASASPNPAVLATYAPIQTLTVSGTSAPDILVTPIVLDTAYFATTLGEESAAGLRVTLTDAGLVAQLVSPTGQIREAAGPVRVGGGTGSFPSDWTVRVQDRQLTVTTDSAQVSTPIAPERSVTLNWAQVTGEDRPDWLLTVDLAGGALDFAGHVHAWATWAAIAFLGAAIVLLWWPRRPHLRSVLARCRLRPVDWLVLAAVTFSGFVSRTTYDDGWVLNWGRELAQGTWGPSTPLMQTPGSSGHLPQGFLYSTLLGFTGGQFEAVIGIRSLTIVLVFITWLGLSRSIMPRLFETTSRQLNVAAAAYVVLFGFGWMTLRTEIPVAALSALFLGLAASTSYRHPALRIAGLCGLVAAAIATHPVGLMLVVPLAVVLIPDLVSRSIDTTQKLTGILLGAAAGIVIVFFNQSAALLRQSLDEYEDIPIDPFNEWGRFSDMMRIGTITQRAWFIAGLVGLVALWAVAGRTLLRPGRYSGRSILLFAVAAMPFGVVFTASKWLWHYAALALPMTVGLLLLVDAICRSPRRRVLGTIVTIGVVSWMGLSIKDSEFDRQWTSWLVLSTLLLVLAVMLLVRRQERVRVGLAMSVVTVLTAGVTTWNAVELTIHSPNDWSFLKQSTLGLFDSDLRCGISSVITIDGADLTAHQVISNSGFTAGVQSDYVLQNPCYFPPSRVAGGAQPAFGSTLTYEAQDPATWLHTDVLRAGCATLAGPGRYMYPYCFRESLPSGTPQIPAAFID